MCLLVYPIVVVDVVSPCVSHSLFTFFIVPQTTLEGSILSRYTCMDDLSIEGTCTHMHVQVYSVCVYVLDIRTYRIAGNFGEVRTPGDNFDIFDAIGSWVQGSKVRGQRLSSCNLLVIQSAPVIPRRDSL